MVCRRDGARGQITEGIAKQYPGPSKTADLLVFTGENRHRRWHCLECLLARFQCWCIPLSFGRSAFTCGRAAKPGCYALALRSCDPALASRSPGCAPACDSEELVFIQTFSALFRFAHPRLKRLRKNVYSVRSASLYAGLRQSGIVHFQQLSGTDESVP